MQARLKNEKQMIIDAAKQMIKIVLPLIILFILFRYKPLILLIIFEILDLLKLMILRKRFLQFPLDLVFVFGVTAAYYYSFLISVIVFILGIINRIEVAHIKDRHVTKCIRHFTLFFLTTILTNYPFFTLATFILLLNYVIKYYVSFMWFDGKMYLKSFFHIFNFIVSLVLFF